MKCVVGVAVLAAVLVIGAPARADDVEVGLNVASGSVTTSSKGGTGDNANVHRSGAETAPGVITYVRPCDLGVAGCMTFDLTCPKPKNQMRYEVLRDGVRTGRTVCFTDKELTKKQQVTPTQVLHEARRYSWTAPDLHIQPDAGWTLVNLPTNAYTTLAQRETKSFSLLGHAIVVEAAPRSYAWTWGDGSLTSTSTPGRRITDDPNGRVDLQGCVTHVYARHGSGLTVSVAAVYAGRYRVDGGAWQRLSGTLTVPGEHLTLDVQTATPVLVAGG